MKKEMADDFERVVARLQGIEPPASEEPEIVEDRKPLLVGMIAPEDHPFAGMVYIGISPSTLMPFYMMPRDSGFCKWHEAMDRALKHKARLPSIEEMGVIRGFALRGSLKDTFNTMDAHHYNSSYWSNNQVGHNLSSALVSRLIDGEKFWRPKERYATLRLVGG